LPVGSFIGSCLYMFRFHLEGASSYATPHLVVQNSQHVILKGKILLPCAMKGLFLHSPCEESFPRLHLLG
jgi:hypothetical protein